MKEKKRMVNGEIIDCCENVKEKDNVKEWKGWYLGFELKLIIIKEEEIGHVCAV